MTPGNMQDWAAAGAETHLYRFSWRPKGAPMGAGHCLELALLLGEAEDWADAPMLGDAAPGEVEALGYQLRLAWAAFARGGTPPQATAWLERL